MTVIGTEKLSGVEVEIDVSLSGHFRIQTKDGDPVGHGADTLDKALANARSELSKRKVKVSVPFTIIKKRNFNRDPEARNGVATSKHGKTHKIMAKVDGESVQLDTYAKVFKIEMPQERIDRLLEVRADISELRTEEHEIEKEWEFNLGQAVDDAIAQKIEDNERGISE